MNTSGEHDQVTADANDAMTSIRATGEDRSGQVGRVETESADVSGDDINQPHSHG